MLALLRLMGTSSRLSRDSRLHTSILGAFRTSCFLLTLSFLNFLYLNVSLGFAVVFFCNGVVFYVILAIYASTMFSLLLFSPEYRDWFASCFDSLKYWTVPTLRRLEAADWLNDCLNASSRFSSITPSSHSTFNFPVFSDYIRSNASLSSTVACGTDFFW